MLRGMEDLLDATDHTPRSIRALLGMTQMELADEAGVSARTLADLEAGLARMRVGTLTQVAEAMTRRGFPITASGLLAAAERQAGRAA